MSSSASGPVNPSQSQQTQSEQTQRVQKIEKVEETDPEKKAKKKFQAYMEEEEETPVALPLPSPFDVSYYSGLKGAPITDSSVTPVPGVLKGSEISSELPESEGFWQTVDLPDAPPKQQELTPSGKPSTGNLATGKAGRQKQGLAQPLPPLPTQVQPSAAQAVNQAAPYLSPQTAALFYQMVGTILIMTTPPGISRTEVLLDSPAFRGSVFYGSTITIEKYATAPDQLNIRLTGNPQAVNLFNQNMPSLMQAFQSGSFAFRVNRIDTEHAPARPLFHRKGPASGKDLGGGV